MNIIFKHTFKNIFKKPIRSLILIICVMVTCLAAYLTLDMSRSIEDMIGAFLTDMIGDVDLKIASNKALDLEMLSEFPECTAVGLASTDYPVATRNPEQYSYEYVKDFCIYGLDTEAGYKLGMFADELTLADDEVAVSTTYAETFRLQEGDYVDLYDTSGATYSYKIAKILQESGLFIAEDEYTAVVNQAQICKLLNIDEMKYYSLMINVTNDKEVSQFCDLMEEKYPDIEVVRVKGNEDIQKAISQIVTIFVVLFVVTFLMVIFVTVSLSEKIVNERMAVIGTFRSLGISGKVTTAVLLLENIFYGVMGFLLARVIYGLARDIIMGKIVTSTEGEISVQPMQKWIHFAVLLGAIIVECFTPAKELTKAMKIAIRDIIFSNKDTDYVFSRKKTIWGLALLGISLILSLIKQSFCLIIGMIMIVVAVSMIMPMIIKKVAAVLGNAFEKANLPIAELAAKEMGTKKNTISNSILCLSVSALAIALFACGNGLIALTDYQSYDADIIGIGTIEDRVHYSYIEDIDGVDEVYYIHSTADYLKVTGAEKEVMFDITALPKTDMMVGIPNLPEQLAKDECVLSAVWADQLGVKAGDSMEVVFKAKFLFPVTKTLRIVSLTDSSLYETTPLIVINEKLYEDVYHDEIGCILVRSKKPEEVIEVIHKYTLNQSVDFKTRAERAEDQEKEKKNIRTAIYVIIGLGIILSIVGLSGNQALGFEARRREYAGMYSTSMSQAQIKRLIFLETFFSMGISVILGTLLGMILNFMIRNITKALVIPLPITLSVGQYLTMAVVLILILVFCSLKPIRMLKKMKIAEELKYE